ncbi:MAG: sensor histidine kinase [Candidatus Thorarchaeota archaeon]
MDQKLEDILRRLILPPTKITGIRNRLRAKFVAGLSLLVIPALLYLQFELTTTTGGPPIWFTLSAILFVGYVLVRTGHLRPATALLLFSFSIFPYAALSLYSELSEYGQSLVFGFVIITILIGSFLVSLRSAVILISAHNIAYLVFLISTPLRLVGINRISSSYALLFGISLLVIGGAWVRHYYVAQYEIRNRSLSEQHRELDLYISLLRHDLTNDLFVIQGYIQYSVHELSPDQTSAIECLESSQSTGKRMANLLKAVSDPIRQKTVNLAEFVEDIASQAMRASKGLTIEVRSDSACREFLVTHRLLPMVFTNLFRNAAEHAGPTVQVEVDLRELGEIIQIVVADDGPGIESAKVPELFKRDTGVGLYLTNRIIGLYGGTIEYCEIPEVKGSRFVILLPMEFTPSLPDPSQIASDR